MKNWDQLEKEYRSEIPHPDGGLSHFLSWAQKKGLVVTESKSENPFNYKLVVEVEVKYQNIDLKEERWKDKLIGNVFSLLDFGSSITKLN